MSLEGPANRTLADDLGRGDISLFFSSKCSRTVQEDYARPHGEPAAVVHAAQNFKLRDYAWPQITSSSFGFSLEPQPIFCNRLVFQ